MKKSKLMFSAAFALFVMLAPAFAQTGAMRVRVPFDFTVDKQTMTAGDWRVTVNGPALQFLRIDGRGAGAVLTNYIGGGSHPDLRPRLVFHVYGGHYFLSEAWIGDAAMGHELSNSAAEKEYARTVQPDRTVILAASNPH